MSWFRKAAGQGEAVAEHNLGCIYLYGRGVPRDDGEALAWFRKAADHRYADAAQGLAALSGPRGWLRRLLRWRPRRHPG